MREITVVHRREGMGQNDSIAPFAAADGRACRNRLPRSAAPETTSRSPGRAWPTLGAQPRRRPAPRRQGSAWPLEDRDIPRRARNDRIDAPCLFDCPINGERFRAYVEQFLVPTLKPGDVVILDNLGSHKGKAVRRAIRDVGARLVFLPIYSPDLNPIEQVFATFKTLLRKAQARSYEAVSQACAQILTQYPPTECAAYIERPVA